MSRSFASEHFCKGLNDNRSAARVVKNKEACVGNSALTWVVCEASFLEGQTRLALHCWAWVADASFGQQRIAACRTVLWDCYQTWDCVTVTV